MGLSVLLPHLAGLIPVLTPAELEVFVRTATALQGLGLKVVDQEVMAQPPH